MKYIILMLVSLLVFVYVGYFYIFKNDGIDDVDKMFLYQAVGIVIYLFLRYVP